MDDNRLSIAASDTTFHSFHDVELIEAHPQLRRTTTTLQASHIITPVSASSHKPNSRTSSSDSINEQQPPTAVKMQRQDSGYESYSATPRTSISHSRPVPVRRISNSSSSGNPRVSQSRGRPSTRRSAQSYQQPPSQSLYHVRTGTNPAHPTALYQFPVPDTVTIAENTPPQEARATPPPATTHYWTSDNTRRLEYAAIDAASRGIKGWLRRNLVPDCFCPKHIAFDDDSGSVRRYRLELEDDQKSKCETRRRKGWQRWPLRKSNSF